MIFRENNYSYAKIINRKALKKTTLISYRLFPSWSSTKCSLVYEADWQEFDVGLMLADKGITCCLRSKRVDVTAISSLELSNSLKKHKICVT